MNKFPNQTWNNTNSSYPSDLHLHTLFEEQVRKSPDAMALIDGESFTYEELNRKANQLAYYLRDHGVNIGSIVSCHLENSLQVVIYILAILKAGGTYLLLDPKLPRERLLYFIENAEVFMVITDTEFKKEGLSESIFKSLQVLTAKETNESAQMYNIENLCLPFDYDNPAYLAYTSGTTGKPKAVLISHRSCVNHAYAFSKMLKLSPSDRVPLIASITFDVAIEEMVPPLISGCTLVSTNSTYENIKEFDDEVSRKEYTILNLPSPLWHTWTEYLIRTNGSIPKSLRLVIVGSDRIYTKHYEEWCRLPGAENVHWVGAYGTTETTVTSSFYTTAREDDLSSEAIIPIGKPIANTYFYLLNEKMEPLGVGEVGELYIGGDGIGLGYHKLPEETKKKFLPDPFCDTPNGRMYKTGDMARYRPDGNFVCLGRKDTQIKIRGLRFELGEIEAIINEHDHVQRSYVVMHQKDDEDESKRLTAFITLKEGVKITDEKVKLHLHHWSTEKLHTFVRPHSFVILVELPVTSSGKVDRAHLEKIAIEYKEVEE